METYKPIPRYPRYEVSDAGNIKNKQTGHVLHPGIKSNGYQIVVLSNDGKRKTEHVHKLVAETFCDKSSDAMVVNHIDGNKTNNSARNLEWCTSSDNNRHAYASGLKVPTKPYNQPARKKIRVIETGEIYDSIDACARSIGANRRHISDCINGRLTKHHGFHYEEL